MSILMQPEFSTRMSDVFHAIDHVLVAHHTLRASLKPPYPPLGDFENGVWIPAPLDTGLAHYGVGPLFGLWCECRAVEALRVAWTGKASPVVHPPASDTQQNPEAAQQNPEAAQQRPQESTAPETP